MTAFEEQQSAASVAPDDAPEVPSVACPRCCGCGYEEACEDCWRDVVLVKRPGCYVCGGTGRVPCRWEPPHTDPEHLCSAASEAPGAPCYHCDRPTPLDGSSCPHCWIPVPNNLADQKAMFADMGLSLTRGESDV